MLTLFLWTVPGYMYSELVVFYFFVQKFCVTIESKLNGSARKVCNCQLQHECTIDHERGCINVYCLCGYRLHALLHVFPPSLVVFKTKVSTHLYQRLCPHLAGPKDQRSSIVENQPPVVCAAVSISFFVNLSN